MDYRSPIEIYTHEPIFQEMEDGIMRATVSCGVQIDKDELIRALAYDREQYRAGYEAAERKYKRPEGDWVGEADGYWNGELIYDVWHCPFCDYRIEEDEQEQLPNFCPNCGAKMGGIEG